MKGRIMARFYLLPVIAFTSFLALFFPQNSLADCVADTSPAQLSISNPVYAARFGAWISVYSRVVLGDCDDYVTDIDNYPTKRFTEENSDSHASSFSLNKIYNEGLTTEYTVPLKSAARASSSIPTASISSHIHKFGETLGPVASAKADFVDLILIENPSAQSTDVNYIPVTFCSDLKSDYTTVTSSVSNLTYADYTYDGELRNYDDLIWDAGSSKTILHTSKDKVCSTGDIKMTGKYVYFSLRNRTYTLGVRGIETVTRADGATVNITVRDGTISANTTLGSLPTGATCYSASGSFPGCERPLYENMMGVADADPTLDGRSSGRQGDDLYALGNCPPPSESTGPGAAGANPFYGNPMNIALGYKKHVETDYAGGRLSFTRVYRSDSEWTNNYMGERWRHNFDRSFNVITTSEATTADITDASGAITIFRYDSTADAWSPVDNGVMTSLANVYDNTPTHIGYLYTTNDDTKEYYDLDGLLTRMEYSGGEALDLEYDASDRLDTVTNERGKTLEFSYNANDKISSVATPTGTFTYAYDTDENLSTVTKPDTEVRTYHYEDTNFDHALTGITDEKGVRFATYGYDSSGRATSTKHAGDVNEYTIAYNSDETTTTTNPLGKQTIYTFETIHGERKIVDVDGQASTNCPAAGKSYTYNADGFVESKTDWLGNITEFERDSRGYITSIIEAVGEDEERTTTITYDSTYRLPNVVTQNGKTTDYDYDSDGRLTSVTVTDTGTSETRTTTYSYYANTTDGNGNTVLGKLYQVSGSRTDVTDVTTFAYDSSRRLQTVTNALSHVTEITSYDNANRPLKFEDVNDVETTLVYDSLGRLTSSTRAFGTALAATTTYGYDDNGNLTSIEAPNGVELTYTYDNAHRLTGIEDDLGNTITYTFDDAGNITQADYKNATPTLKYTHSYVFDELSRIIENVDANNDALEFAYDVNSNLTEITDAETNDTSFDFDALDRLIEITDALNGVTVFDLNDLDQNEGTTDPRNNETSYSYNAFGDVTQEVSPDRGTISYTHDKAGNVTQMTDARSVVTNYTYDAINRLTDIEYPSDSSLDVELTYDSASGCGTSKGRLCSVSDAAGTTTYIYDDLSRLTDVTETRGALSFTTEYSYDLSSILTGITLPSGREVTYTLNNNGQVSSVAAEVNSTNTTLASSITYLPFGPMASMSYGNSITLTDTYNTAYQLTNRTIGSLMNQSYTYDDAGNITDVGSDSYTLDDLYRITAENSDSYTYDAIGNRLTKNSDDYTYPTTSSKLSDVEGDSVSYDAAGNITDDTARDYTINAAGQVEEIEISSVTVGEYVYDANNLRTKKTANSTDTYYVYGMGGLLYGEYDSSGDLVREYVYLNGEPLAQIDSGETLTYLHTDHLSTPRYGTNTAGTQVWAWDSDVFGNGIPTGTVTVNLRFPGQYWDDESGLHYNWNRYYNPETGRYVSSDPIGLSGGLNTYLYANAHPGMFIDPEGLATAAPMGRIFGSSWGPYATTACGLNPICRWTEISLRAASVCAETAGHSIGHWINEQNNASEDKKKAEEGRKGAAAGAPMPDPDDPDPKDKIKPPYGGKTPADKPGNYTNIKGSSAKRNKDGSIWDKDHSQHGGSVYKRWANQKDWEKGLKPESIRVDGSVR